MSNFVLPLDSDESKDTLFVYIDRLFDILLVNRKMKMASHSRHIVFFYVSYSLVTLVIQTYTTTIHLSKSVQPLGLQRQSKEHTYIHTFRHARA